MSAATLPTPPAPAAGRRGGAARVVAIVIGALLALIAGVLLIAGAFGLWADATQRDADGWLSSPTHHFDTTTRALSSEGLRLGDVRGRADELVSRLGPVRVRARRAGGRPVFVAIAPASRVDAYLRGVAHTKVTELRSDGFNGSVVTGDRVPGAPARFGGWAASAAGPGTQTAEWDPRSGRWAIVVMNADGSPGVAADVSVGARASWLGSLAWGLFGAGALLGIAAAALIALGVSGPRTASAQLDATAPLAEEPVTVTARLDEPLSRWLWLFKGLLLIPHLVILALLWCAFVPVTLIAMVAIVLTGRYPRGLFDFNAGVLRWTWRVGFYGSAAFATDRYPPFSLKPADYPAELEIAYPQRLSRWQAPLKPWLLALPHYAALGALVGAWNVTWTFGAASVTPPGLLGVLLLVAVVLLVVRGRYPRDVFALVVGINRWALRVAAYAALMRDEYPPFRLDR